MVVQNACLLAVFIFLVGKFEFVSTQVPYFGSCPVLNVEPNFNLVWYSGNWFEAEKYPTISTPIGRCITARYFYDKKGKFRVYNQQILAVTNQEDSILGVMWSENGARLKVALPTFPFYREDSYWVLATDYCTYAVVFSCQDNFGLFHNRYVWIYTRYRHPPPDILLKAYNAMDDNGLERRHLRRTQQKGCEDYAPMYSWPGAGTICG